MSSPGTRIERLILGLYLLGWDDDKEIRVAFGIEIVLKS